MPTRLALALATILALAPLARSPAAATGEPPSEHRLSVALLTRAFLARLVAIVEAERIEQERVDGAYLQEKRGLIWTRDDGGADRDWYAAADYCAALELGGWEDWRLPTIEELEALHSRRSIDTYKLPPGFHLTGCCPWSSSASGEGSAWNFSFRHRKRFSGARSYSFELRALCVRPASEADEQFYLRIAEEAKQAARERRRGS